MAGQDPYSKIDLIGFNLKMLAKGHQRSLLISAGAADDKKYLLEACRKMSEIGVNLYATPGTHRFLAEHGIEFLQALDDLLHATHFDAKLAREALDLSVLMRQELM